MDKKTLLWSARKRLLFFGLPWTFTKYGYSNERIFISKGLLRTVEDEVRLYRIMDLSLERTLAQKIFGLGTIKFCSADKTLGDFEFKNIKNASQVKEQLSELIEQQRTQKRVVNREAMYNPNDFDIMDEVDNDV